MPALSDVVFGNNTYDPYCEAWNRQVVCGKKLGEVNIEQRNEPNQTGPNWTELNTSITKYWVLSYWGKCYYFFSNAPNLILPLWIIRRDTATHHHWFAWNTTENPL